MVPDPPDFSGLPPLVETWERGKPLVRVYAYAHPPTAFRAGGTHGRFHPFQNAAGEIVPVLYASDMDDGAISEAVFRDVGAGGGIQAVAEVRLTTLSLVSLRPKRDLQLASLAGHGLRRYRVRPRDLTDTPPITYSKTALWAKAMHRALPPVDGIQWMSRQFNTARAVVLFGDRVRARDLEVAADPIPLIYGEGRRRVERAANQADILLLP